MPPIDPLTSRVATLQVQQPAKGRAAVVELPPDRITPGSGLVAVDQPNLVLDGAARGTYSQHYRNASGSAFYVTHRSAAPASAAEGIVGGAVLAASVAALAVPGVAEGSAAVAATDGAATGEVAGGGALARLASGAAKALREHARDLRELAHDPERLGRAAVDQSLDFVREKARDKAVEAALTGGAAAASAAGKWISDRLHNASHHGAGWSAP